MNIIWSPQAISRVLEAAAYIARDKPSAAARWADRIFDVVDPLEDHPRQGRLVAEAPRPETRELWYGEYRVVYRIEGDVVLILTVRHGRRLLDLSELDQEAR